MFTIKLITQYTDSLQKRTQVYSTLKYEKYDFPDRTEYFFSSPESTGLRIGNTFNENEGVKSTSVYVENLEGKTIDSTNGYFYIDAIEGDV